MCIHSQGGHSFSQVIAEYLCSSPVAKQHSFSLVPPPIYMRTTKENEWCPIYHTGPKLPKQLSTPRLLMRDAKLLPLYTRNLIWVDRSAGRDPGSVYPLGAAPSRSWRVLPRSWSGTASSSPSPFLGRALVATLSLPPPSALVGLRFVVWVPGKFVKRAHANDRLRVVEFRRSHIASKLSAKKTL